MRALRAVLGSEDINFLLTNRIPRLAVTHWVGWLSRIKSPLLTRVSIWIWRLFTDLDLSEAKEQRFESLRDCFIRELKPGARPINADPSVYVSPCDGIVGAMGRVEQGRLFQAKGFSYRLDDFLIHDRLLSQWANAQYLTIRLTSAMYHRFHAPYEGRLTQVHYISGDTWNVNPVALSRIESLFCKNERAILEAELGPQNLPCLMIPIAAILVASMRIHALDRTFTSRLPGRFSVPVDCRFAKGQELGWFEHGSTIILMLPAEFALAEGIQTGSVLKMGQSLLRML
ncbi:MAG: archaetidylserine decarboxylase [Burkholderiaceae bacterium]